MDCLDTCPVMDKAQQDALIDAAKTTFVPDFVPRGDVGRIGTPGPLASCLLPGRIV